MPMPTYKNTNYSLIYATLAIVVICCLSIAGPHFIQPALNNMAGKLVLREFETAFQDVQHPTGTEYVSLRTAMGNFGGSEQGCDFSLGEVRRFEGSEDVILAAYMDQEVKGYPIQVVFLDGGQIPDQVGDSLPEPLNDLADWEIPPDVEQQALYMVYLAILNYEGNQKLNCR